MVERSQDSDRGGIRSRAARERCSRRLCGRDLGEYRRSFWLRPNRRLPDRALQIVWRDKDLRSRYCRLPLEAGEGYGWRRLDQWVSTGSRERDHAPDGWTWC